MITFVAAGEGAAAANAAADASSSKQGREGFNAQGSFIMT
jgi:hypothetical protein